MIINMFLKCNKGVFFISGKNGRYMLKFILDFYMKKQILELVFDKIKWYIMNRKYVRGDKAWIVKKII